MKAAELRALSKDKLQALYLEKARELVVSKMKRKSGIAIKSDLLVKNKRDIARILTIMHEQRNQ
jgi:ribosomal protein L29